MGTSPSAASGTPEWAWDTYGKAFADLGVTDFAPIPIDDRDAANSVAREAGIEDQVKPVLLKHMADQFGLSLRHEAALPDLSQAA